MEKNVMKLKETASGLLAGEITIQRRELFMAGALCLLAGIVIGLCHAPCTRKIIVTGSKANRKKNSQECGCTDKA